MLASWNSRRLSAVGFHRELSVNIASDKKSAEIRRNTLSKTPNKTFAPTKESASYRNKVMPSEGFSRQVPAR